MDNVSKIQMACILILTACLFEFNTKNKTLHLSDSNGKTIVFNTDDSPIINKVDPVIDTELKNRLKIFGFFDDEVVKPKEEKIVKGEWSDFGSGFYTRIFTPPDT